MQLTHPDYSTGGPVDDDPVTTPRLGLDEANDLAELERWAIIDSHEATTPFEESIEGPTCGICDGIHGARCPIESPDPGYYADEMAAGR